MKSRSGLKSFFPPLPSLLLSLISFTEVINIRTSSFKKDLTEFRIDNNYIKNIVNNKVEIIMSKRR